jgi:hypothetical protein
MSRKPAQFTSDPSYLHGKRITRSNLRSQRSDTENVAYRILRAAESFGHQRDVGPGRCLVKDSS